MTNDFLFFYNGKGKGKGKGKSRKVVIDLTEKKNSPEEDIKRRSDSSQRASFFDIAPKTI